jgi:hypothetical protein
MLDLLQNAKAADSAASGSRCPAASPLPPNAPTSPSAASSELGWGSLVAMFESGAGGGPLETPASHRSPVQARPRLFWECNKYRMTYTAVRQTAAKGSVIIRPRFRLIECASPSNFYFALSRHKSLFTTGDLWWEVLKLYLLSPKTRIPEKQLLR